MEETCFMNQNTMKYILLALIAYLAPIRFEIYLVVALCLIDWMTGVSKGIKNHSFTSAKSIRKFWVLTGYMLGLMAMRSIEMYLLVTFKSYPSFQEKIGPDVLVLLQEGWLVRTMVFMILVTEIKSLQENVKELSGVDIFQQAKRLIPNVFEKKR
jgi:hypothetical protein